MYYIYIYILSAQELLSCLQHAQFGFTQPGCGWTWGPGRRPRLGGKPSDVSELSLLYIYIYLFIYLFICLFVYINIEINIIIMIIKLVLILIIQL